MKDSPKPRPDSSSSSPDIIKPTSNLSVRLKAKPRFNKFALIGFVGLFVMVGIAVRLLTQAAAPPGAASIEGEVLISHEDDFTHSKSNQKYSIKTKSGVHYRLETTADKSKLLANKYVKVSGTIKAGHRMQPTRIDKAQPPQSLLDRLMPKARAEAAPLGSSTGTKKVLTIRFNFKNDKRQPFTADDVRRKVFTNTTSLNAYIKEASYNQLNLTGRDRIDGDVVGWFTIDNDNSYCDDDNWRVAATAKAKAAGVNTLGYDLIIYVFPSTSSCNYEGAAYPKTTADPSYYIYTNGSLAADDLGHEFGHILGLAHADSYRCMATGSSTRTVINFNTSRCNQKEYDDPFDVMGYYSSPQHYSAYNKSRLGWIKPANNILADHNGSYVIAPLEQDSDGPHMLRVPTRAGQYKVWDSNVGFISKSFQQYYYIEHRKTYGFDGKAYSGVVVRLGADKPLDSYTMHGPDSLLLDATPSTDKFTDAQLPTGRIIDDGEVKIQLIEQTVTGATLKITFVNPPATPTPTPTPSPTVAPLSAPTDVFAEERYVSTTRTIHVSWHGSTGNVAGYKIFKNGVQIGTSTSWAFDDRDVNQVFEGNMSESYDYTVKAYDNAGNESSASAPYHFYVEKCDYAC